MLSLVMIGSTPNHHVALLVDLELIAGRIVGGLETMYINNYFDLNYEAYPELCPPRSIPERVTCTARSKGFTYLAASSRLLVVSELKRAYLSFQVPLS